MKKTKFVAKIQKRGSLLIVAIAALALLFFLTMTILFWTGSEDYSSSFTYEGEVAFNIAEAAVEEFINNLKTLMNPETFVSPGSGSVTFASPPADGGKLYAFLRQSLEGGSEGYKNAVYEMPTEDITNLLPITMSKCSAYGIGSGGDSISYGCQFTANEIIGVKIVGEPMAISDVGADFLTDPVEKDIDVNFLVKVVHKNRKANIDVNFKIRVVKPFLSPFNFFTLYIKELNDSNLNPFPSAVGYQQAMLRLDNGWNFFKVPKMSSNESAAAAFAGNFIDLLNNDLQVPIGKVYLGRYGDALPDSKAAFTSGNPAPPFPLQVVNSNKTHMKDAYQFNTSLGKEFMGADLLLAPPDINGDNLVTQEPDFKKFLQMQIARNPAIKGVSYKDEPKDSWKHQFYARYYGSGDELLVNYGLPAQTAFFTLWPTDLEKLRKETKKDGITEDLAKKFFPPLNVSGFHPFGTALHLYKGDPAHHKVPIYEHFSPTYIFGNVSAKFFQASFFVPAPGTDSAPDPQFQDGIMLPYVVLGEGDREVSLNKLKEILKNKYKISESGSVVETAIFTHFEKAWSLLPKELKTPVGYRTVMSQPVDLDYNSTLLNVRANLLSTPEYVLDYANPSVTFDPSSNPLKYKLGEISLSGGIGDYFKGNLYDALPSYAPFMFDFYFLNRATEDMLRGRTTVAQGGNSIDRFQTKYMPEQDLLSMSGILVLNDSTPLILANAKNKSEPLKYRGRGVIYSSPAMMSGPVVIEGSLLPYDLPGDFEGSLNSVASNQLLTIVAPQIIIDTTSAPGDRCYVYANLISVEQPLHVKGNKPITIIGSVATPNLDLLYNLPPGSNETASSGSSRPSSLTQTELDNIVANAGYDRNKVFDNVIIFNPRNVRGAAQKDEVYRDLYVAKVVTGGVGKYTWNYTRN
ncbi:MAG: hypothetical protein GX221_06885 [Candidatus Riflebacteria bacterium]|nr:hypothetical protein [Candidatus Riflebacteria bacterium]